MFTLAKIPFAAQDSFVIRVECKKKTILWNVNNYFISAFVAIFRHIESFSIFKDPFLQAIWSNAVLQTNQEFLPWSPLNEISALSSVIGFHNFTDIRATSSLSSELVSGQRPIGIKIPSLT